MTASVLAMKPVGPVADAWRVSRAFIAGIMGPVGSGKTSTGVAKCFGIAALQPPVTNARGERIRYARGAVIRDTYPNLDSTVLATWHQWVPREVGKYTHDAPRRHIVRIGLMDGTFLQLEMLFIAIGDKRVEDVLRGLELTFAWLNEADRLHREVLAYLTGRVGRYPGPKLGGCIDPTIMLDFNAPDADNWLYEMFVDQTMDPAIVASLSELLQGRPVIEFFQQPGARDPGAENVHNLPTGYYDLQYAAPTNADYKARMLDNKFVPLRHGQPVYPEFNLLTHVAAGPVTYDPARKLIVGMDAGLTPAAVFVQRTAMGQLRVLHELVVFPEADETLSGVGPTRFGLALGNFIAEHFPSIDMSPRTRVRRQLDRGHDVASVLRYQYSDTDIEFWCDPAAKDGTDKSGNEKSWLEIVQAQIGQKIRPASTNRLHVRLESVRRPMLSMIDGHVPGFLLAKSCKILRKGFISGYHVRRVAVGGDGTGRFDSEPSKNMFSHVQDALQYAAMADGAAVAEIMGKVGKSAVRAARARGGRGVQLGNGYFSGG